MKSLPILTVCLVLLSGVVWSVGDPVGVTSPALADDTTEVNESQKDASTDDAPQTEEEQAIALIEEARRRLLYDRGSVQATIRETVSMGLRKFQGEGTYVAGRFPKLKLSMVISVGETSGELLEVCDGTILWTVQKIDSGAEESDVQVARTVIGDILAAQEGVADVSETYLIVGLGVGGLPALLASLERSMTFEAIRELDDQGQQFTVVQGRWSDEYLNRVTDGQGESALPEYMPDHVRIYFDAESKFPTRILYLRRTEPNSGKFVALLSLEFSDIVLDAPINEEQFQYTPPSTVKVRDRTTEYLKMLNQAAAAGRGEATPEAEE